MASHSDLSVCLSWFLSCTIDSSFILIKRLSLNATILVGICGKNGGNDRQLKMGRTPERIKE
jgi:hypothetical protein